MRQTFRLTLTKTARAMPANSKQGTGIKPGDLKFVDVTGDGIVNDDDKTELGDPHPDVTMGYHSRCILQGLRPFCNRLWSIRSAGGSFIPQVHRW